MGTGPTSNLGSRAHGIPGWQQDHGTTTRRADEGSGNLAASPVSAFHCAAGRPAGRLGQPPACACLAQTDGRPPGPCAALLPARVMCQACSSTLHAKTAA